MCIFRNTSQFIFRLFPEKLLTSSGRELRRALFSLKQIFQVLYTCTGNWSSFSGIVIETQIICFFIPYAANFFRTIFHSFEAGIANAISSSK